MHAIGSFTFPYSARADRPLACPRRTAPPCRSACPVNPALLLRLSSQSPVRSPAAPARHAAARPRRTQPPTQLHALAPEEAFAPLITERLILRPLLPHDAESLHRLVNDWEVTRTLAVVPFPYPRPLADDWIASTPRARSPPASPTTSPSPAATATTRSLLGVVGLRLDAQDAHRHAGLLGRPPLLGARRGDRGRRAHGALGLRQSRHRPHPGQRGDRQSRLRRGAAPHRLPPDRRGHEALGGARRRASGLAFRGHPRRRVRPARGAAGSSRHQADAAGRRLRADRQRRPRAAGPPPGGQDDGRAVGISRRQAASGRNAGGRADPRTEGGARHRRLRRLPGAVRVCVARL